MDDKKRVKQNVVRQRTVRRKRLPPIGLSSKEAGLYLGLSEAMMRKMRSLGTGPPHKKIGSKIIYLRKDLQEWLESQ